MFYSTFFCWYHDQVLFCSFEFLILCLAKNALLDKNARCCCNEGSSSRGSCFRWWDLLLFFIMCRQILSIRFHECSESTVAIHVITTTLLYRWWDANIHIFSLLQLSCLQKFSAFFQRVIGEKNNRFFIFSCTIMKDAYLSCKKCSGLV